MDAATEQIKLESLDTITAALEALDEMETKVASAEEEVKVLRAELAEARAEQSRLEKVSQARVAPEQVKSAVVALVDLGHLEKSQSQSLENILRKDAGAIYRYLHQIHTKNRNDQFIQDGSPMVSKTASAGDDLVHGLPRSQWSFK